MRLLNCFSCLLLLLPLSIQAQDNALYLNPDNAPGAKASVLFADAELIPLETTKASYFNNIQDFVVTPYHFIFLDNASNTLLIFDKQGNYLHKYKKKKYRINSIQYVPSKNALFVVGRNKNYTIPPAKSQQLIQQSSKQDFSKYVSLELIHLEKNYSVEQLPVPRYALNEIYYFNDKYLTVNGRYNKYITDTIAYHLNVVEGDKIVRSYFPFLNLPKLWPFYESVDIAVDNTQSDTAFYVSRKFDNTVYALNPDSLYSRYPFVFPADKTMPASFQSTLFKNNIDFNTAKNKNNKVISGFYNVLKHQHILFFSTNSLAYERKNFLFNTINKKLYDLGKITSDSTIHFLPSKIFTTVSEQDADYVYTRISSADLLKEKDKLLSKGESIPEKIKELLSKLDKFDNAIIIKLQLQPLTADQ